MFCFVTVKITGEEEGVALPAGYLNDGPGEDETSGRVETGAVVPGGEAQLSFAIV